MEECALIYNFITQNHIFYALTSAGDKMKTKTPVTTIMLTKHSTLIGVYNVANLAYTMHIKLCEGHHLCNMRKLTVI